MKTQPARPSPMQIRRQATAVLRQRATAMIHQRRMHRGPDPELQLRERARTILTDGRRHSPATTEWAANLLAGVQP